MAPRISNPPIFKPRGSVFNARTVTAPIAALTMAVLLYTYSVTSIRAAKRNAALHREADGGQLDMRRESLRRHGVLDKVEGTRGLELFRNAKKEVPSKEAALREAGKDSDTTPAAAVGPRTEVEGELEGYKGRGSAVSKFRKEG